MIPRPFAQKRPLGPFFTGPNIPDVSSVNEELRINQLSDAGAESISTTAINDTLVIDFLTVGTIPEHEFDSSVEISSNGIHSALLRLPHVLAGQSVWDTMSEDIAFIIADNTDIDPFEGLLKTDRRYAPNIQPDGVIIRPNDGFVKTGSTILTPHIQFLATDMSGEAPTVPVTFDQITSIVSRLNDLWSEKYSDLETVESREILEP